jgi:hypothetical protein
VLRVPSKQNEQCVQRLRVTEQAREKKTAKCIVAGTGTLGQVGVVVRMEGGMKPETML